MNGKSNNSETETQMIYALTMSLMNILIVLILGGVGWVLYQAVGKSEIFELFARNHFSPR